MTSAVAFEQPTSPRNPRAQSIGRYELLRPIKSNTSDVTNAPRRHEKGDGCLESLRSDHPLCRSPSALRRTVTSRAGRSDSVPGRGHNLPGISGKKGPAAGHIFAAPARHHQTAPGDRAAGVAGSAFFLKIH